MGVVYKAWHPTLQEHAAVKIMLEGLNEVDIERFKRESRVKGDCEYIVQVKYAGTHKGNHT